MTAKAVKTDRAPNAAGPYSQGIIAGNMVFSAGQIPVDPATGSIPATIEGQAEQAICNVLAIMKEAGVQDGNITYVTIYLTDINDFSRVNEIYAKHMVEPYPARSCVAVAALPKGVKIMISAVGMKQ